MKRISAAFLFLCVSLLTSQSSLAKDEDIQPQVCKPDGGNIRCVTLGKNLFSGGGDNYGPWYTLVSTAPAGYRVKEAEGHVGDHPFPKKSVHMCGVRDEGTGNPSPISNVDGPTKGHRTGRAFWAECYIAEEDATHVVLKVHGQGEQNPGDARQSTGPIGSPAQFTIYLFADLQVVYEKIPAK